MEKTLPVLPTTKTSNSDPASDAGVTLFRDSERDDDMTGDFAGDFESDSASDATMPIIDAAPDKTADKIPADFAMSEHTFAEEIELSTKEPVKVDADPELMDSLGSVPSKMAFKIGEVAEMLGVKQYVLRYWETEFEALRPKKSKNNQRVYTRREVETAMLIKKLLYKDRFSIEGARAALKQLRGQVKEERNWKAVAQGQHKIADRLQGLINEIRRMHDSIQ